MDSEVVDAIHYYYKLKQKYVNTARKRKKTIKDSDLSLKDKIRDIRRITTNQNCVACKKPGGTIFSRNNEHLRAKCNATANKCRLDIDIVIGKFYDINTTLKLLLIDEQDNKKQITKLKMDVLYGFIDDMHAETDFAKLTETFDDLQIIIQYWQTELFSIIKNSEHETNKKNIEIHLAEIVQRIKETNDNQVIAAIYKNDVIPTLDAYRGLFSQYFVEHDTETDTHHLKREEFTIADYESSIADDAEIILMIK
jgi:hypothetical protein